MKYAIKIENLSKSHGQSTIFSDLNLEVETGTITVLFGPNGCGKSTFLNILAGILKKDYGEIKIEFAGPRRFSYLHQNYQNSLLPWRTNLNNLTLPLEIEGYSKKKITERIEEWQDEFIFDFDLKTYPYQLSGGQQQILAFFRALISHPTTILADEPFSALDYENNLQLRSSLRRYQQKHAATILMISHDIEEAVHLSDKILVLSRKPTTVLESISNPLSGLRSIETLNSDEFYRTKQQVLLAFQKATV